MNKNKARRAENSEQRKNGVQSIRQHRICRTMCQTFCPTLALKCPLALGRSAAPTTPFFESPSGFESRCRAVERRCSYQHQQNEKAQSEIERERVQEDYKTC